MPQPVDNATYRSTYLDIIRATDGQGQPIFDAEYDGYDDNGTPDNEADDNYIYIIRHYVLKDTLDTGAYEGVLWLYDPELNRVGSWDISSLVCINHGGCDGLGADASGIHHALRVPVSTSLMPYAGDYRFVLHIKDDHNTKYRDHRRRWAKELNGPSHVPGAAIWTQYSVTTYLGDQAEEELWLITGASNKGAPGYRGYAPCGFPELGGSGHMNNTAPRYAVRTLNYLPPEDPPENRKFCTKNAVWVYYGHANFGLLLFNTDECGLSSNLSEPGCLYDVSSLDLRHIRLAFLAGCQTGGEEGVSQGAVIAHSFSRAGNPQGAKCAVGFYGKIRLTTPWFGTFNTNFWYGMCKEKKTVQKAADEACHIKLPKGKKLKLPGVKPIVFGDKNTVLYPPRYGNQ